MREIIGALSLLVLFVAYQASITAFTHVHYINGVLITHSHPFHGTHSHTKSGLIVIDRLATFQVPDLETRELTHPLRPLLYIVSNEPQDYQAQLEWYEILSLRAPPSFSLTDKNLSF